MSSTNIGPSVTTTPNVVALAYSPSATNTQSAAYSLALPMPLPSGGDDAAAIQAVINAAALAGSGLSTGQYVRVVAQAGSTYLISGLEFKSNVWIDWGNAIIKKIVAGTTVISNSMIRTIDSLNNGSYYGNYDNIRMSGGVFDTNGFDCPAQIIRFENVRDGLLEDVTVKHSAACPRWAFQVGGQRIRVVNPCVLNGSQTFQDGVHITHGNLISVVGGVINAGDDAIACGIDATGNETWDDEALTNVSVVGTVCNSTSATAIKVYFGLNSGTGASGIPGLISGNLRGRVDGVNITGVTGSSGISTNGGIYIMDTSTPTVTATGAFVGGETTATLTANFAGPTGTYVLTFSNGNQRIATLTNGSTAVGTFTALSSGATTTIQFNKMDRLKNINIDAVLHVGSTSNDGSNSTGIYVNFATDVRITGNITITDTPLGSKFSAANINWLDGGDFSVDFPVMPAGPGFQVKNSRAVKVRGATFRGNAGSARGTIEVTGVRGLKVSGCDFYDIATNGTAVLVQSSGSGEFANVISAAQCNATKASGATTTRFYGQQSSSPGFVPFLSLQDIELRGNSNATAVDQVFNSTGITPDEIIVDGIRGFGGGVNKSITLPLAVAYNASITPACASNRGNHLTTTLTGNTTINAPTGMIVGTRLKYVFTQDATGGRTVAWNAVFKFVCAAWVDAVVTTDANKISAIEFEYDGTNWIQCNPNRWV